MVIKERKQEGQAAILWPFLYTDNERLREIADNLTIKWRAW